MMTNETLQQAAAAAESMREQAAALGREVAVFRLAQDAPPVVEQAAEPAGVPFVERRGADRAKNVARLPVKAKAKVEPRAATKKSGTDDEWSEF